MREYFAVYTRVAKPPKVVVYLQDNPEKGSKFLLASIGLNIETSDIYLIRARKMPAVAINGSFTGVDRSKQKPSLERNQTFLRFPFAGK